MNAIEAYRVSGGSQKKKELTRPKGEGVRTKDGVYIPYNRLADAAKATGCAISTIRSRIKAGWSTDKAFTLPRKR
jgi:hypothetical protein